MARNLTSSWIKYITDLHVLDYFNVDFTVCTNSNKFFTLFVWMFAVGIFVCCNSKEIFHWYLGWCFNFCVRLLFLGFQWFVVLKVKPIFFFNSLYLSNFKMYWMNYISSSKYNFSKAHYYENWVCMLKFKQVIKKMFVINVNTSNFAKKKKHKIKI